MVAVIEDDESYRVAVQRLLKSAGFSAQSFACAEDFLSSGQQHETGCLIADIRMPDMSGLDLLREIKKHDDSIEVVGTAMDGELGLKKITELRPNVVTLDLDMPRMDGISLTKKLRENPKFKQTPILILTTESSDQMKMAGRAAGATGWLVKPFDPAKLIEVIGKVVR